MAVTLKEFSEKYGLSRVIEYTFSITNTPIRILKNNPNRFEAIITNLGNEPLYVGYASDVSSIKAIKVAAGGGYTRISVEEDGAACCQEIWAVSTTIGTNAYVQEYEAWK